MDDQTEKAFPNATHVWVRPKAIPEASEPMEWVRVPVFHPIRCSHEQTICLRCADSWANDHEIRYRMPLPIKVILIEDLDGLLLARRRERPSS